MNEDEIAKTEGKNDRKTKGKNEEFKEKNENKLMREIKELSKNSTLNIHRKENFHILFEILESKILGQGSY